MAPQSSQVRKGTVPFEAVKTGHYRSVTIRCSVQPMALVTHGDSEFDRDTAVTRRAPGVYDAELSAGWTIIHAVNGGYLLALLGRALGDALPHPDPFTISAHYLTAVRARPRGDPHRRRPHRPHALDRPGLASSSTTRTAPRSSGSASSPPTATWTPCPTTSGRPPKPPAIPPHRALPRRRGRPAPRSPAAPRITDRLDLKLDPATVGWALGAPSGKGEMRGLVRPRRRPRRRPALAAARRRRAAADRLRAGPDGLGPDGRTHRPHPLPPGPRPAAGLDHHPQPGRRLPGGGRRGLGQRGPTGRPVPPAGARGPAGVAHRPGCRFRLLFAGDSGYGDGKWAAKVRAVAMRNVSD